MSAPRRVPASQLPLPVPTAARCVVTLAAGREGREMLAASGPLMRRYAARVGADFHVISPPDSAFPLAYKFALPRFLRPDMYDRVLFLDADLVVRPSCPDLFALVPDTHLGAYDDLPAVARTGGSDWFAGEVAAFQRSQGLGEAPLAHAWNSGVVALSRATAHAFEPPARPFPRTHCAEQHCFDDAVQRLGIPVFELDESLNSCWWHQGEACERESAHVVHYAGLRPHAARLARLRAQAARYAPKPAPAPPCRFRSGDALTADAIRAEGQNPAREHFRCGKPGFERFGLAVAPCASCNVPAGRRCGSLERCGGYEPAGPDPDG